MKNVLRIFAVICLVFVVTSCSKDDDPADNDLFVGTYNGSVSFYDDDSDVSSDNSSVTVVKAGNNYNFNFNESGIPILSGVQFKEDGDNGMINLDFEDGLQVIRITASRLNILYSKDGKTWTANATR